jgi:chitodextrinase
MIHRNIFRPLIWASLLLLLSTGIVVAQGKSADNHGRSYGVGQPKTIQDLPPGQLRKELEGLPAKARGNALGWLQNFSFPAEDVGSLRVNTDGAIYYVEPVAPGTIDPASTEPTAINAAMDESQVFQLHSRPGSSNVVFLDFDGHTIDASSGWTITTLDALPFDPSQNDNPLTVANFTQDELNRIAEIWHRISEDFASFNVDVTTEEPVEFTSTTGRLLFTHDTDANGKAMPQQGAGGVAFINMFGRDNFVSTYSPSLVYYTNLSTNSYGSATLNAEAGSHEFGHNLGLSHDGTSSGSTYYEGHGNGLVSWAPIMGRPFSANVTHWSQGEYPDANNTQDDLELIAGKVGWIGDDHGDSAALATQLVAEPNGDILVSSPELDPDNILFQNKGTINDRADIDWFYVDVADSGSLHITAVPAWHSFTRSENRGANLDIELALFDADLVLLTANEPDNDTQAAVAAMVTAGRYYLQVQGVGNDTNSGYSDYASTGMYFLEGNTPAGPVDNTPPSPATMSWQTDPYAMDDSSISMTSMQATDDSGSVEYNFSCVAGGNGCRDSGWQSSRTWSPGGLDANTHYSFKVSARDGFGNENLASSIMGDTTDAPAPPAENEPPSAVASYNPAPAVISKGKTASVTLSGSGSSDPDGVIFAWEWRDSNGSTISTDISFATKLRAGTHNFTLTVTDDDGASSSTGLSVSVTKGSDDGGGGGGKPCNPRKTSCN